MAIKKNQHYVWRHYLKPWSVNNKIFCSRNTLLFNTTLKNVAVERFFYESIKLNEKEIEFVTGIISQLEPSFNGPLGFIFKFYIWTTQSKSTSRTGIENFHSNIENRGVRYLNELYNERTSFLEIETEKRHFCNYIGAQYTRTRKMRENMVTASFFWRNEYDMKRLSNIIHIIFINIISDWMFFNSKIRFLKASGDLNFITADQPIINAKGTLNINEYPEKFELYYPITPKLAVYFSKTDEGVKFLNNNDVNAYNELIIKNSHQQLFALNSNEF